MVLGGEGVFFFGSGEGEEEGVVWEAPNEYTIENDDDLCSCTWFLSGPLNMLRSAHTFNVHVKMTNETSL